MVKSRRSDLQAPQEKRGWAILEGNAPAWSRLWRNRGTDVHPPADLGATPCAPCQVAGRGPARDALVGHCEEPRIAPLCVGPRNDRIPLCAMQLLSQRRWGEG